MARRTSIVTIEDEGRDAGKAFFITEMSAAQAEDWAIRAFFALMNTGVEMPDIDGSGGMAELAQVGIQAFSRLPYESAKPLLDEMWECVQYIPDPSKPAVIRALMEDDIEEPATRFKLRKAIFDLHVSFFTKGGQ